MIVKVNDAETVVKRMFFLAWMACGSPMGMGIFQDRPTSTEEDVWNNVCNAGDYFGMRQKKENGEAYGDYVFGRMMKLRIKYTKDTIDIREDEPDCEYQSWCRFYPTYEALLDAALKELEITAEKEQ